MANKVINQFTNIMLMISRRKAQQAAPLSGTIFRSGAACCALSGDFNKMHEIRTLVVVVEYFDFSLESLEF
jgi:hypothetical protein